MWQGHNDPSRADITVVAPGLDGKLDLVLRHCSWRLKCPRTAGHTEQLLGIERESSVPGSLLPGLWDSAFWSQGVPSVPSAFWSQENADYTADANKALWV